MVVLYPGKKSFYLEEKQTLLKMTRLNYILISENLSNLVKSISIKPGYRSDH